MRAGWPRTFPNTNPSSTPAPTPSTASRPRQLSIKPGGFGLDRPQARRGPLRYRLVDMPRIRFHLAWKMVFPFAVLSLVVGAVGTYVASNELGSRARSSFDAQLIHDGFSASSVLESSDAQRRSLVKSLAASPVVLSAWAKPADLEAALERALAGLPSLVVEAVDPRGREIVGISGHGEAAASVTQNLDLSGWTGFQPLLSGRVDQLAFVGLEMDPVAFDGRTVRDHAGALLGMLLVGQPVSDLGAHLRAVSHDEATFF